LFRLPRQHLPVSDRRRGLSPPRAPRGARARDRHRQRGNSRLSRGRTAGRAGHRGGHAAGHRAHGARAALRGLGRRPPRLRARDGARQSACPRAACAEALDVSGFVASGIRSERGPGGARAGSVLRGRRGLRSRARSLSPRLRRIARSHPAGARAVIPAPLADAIEARLGLRVLAAAAVSGGDINQAASVDLEGGTRVFVKWNPRAPGTMFPAEARGLAWLAEAKALRIPNVLAVSVPDDAVRFLVLEWIASGRPARGFDDRLGQGLAALHRAGAPGFGFEQDNFIGSLPQENAPKPTWAEFFAARRLDPQLRRAVDAGRASYSMRRGFERLFARLSEFVGPEEPPARLHGDLWGGNLHVDGDGHPCLIDP